MLTELLALLLASVPMGRGRVDRDGSTCVVYPESDTDQRPRADDTPSVLRAFTLCGSGGRVVFPAGNVYNIERVMNTTNLVNCVVEVHGELVWSQDITYWLAHSLPVVYSNLSTAWVFGGTNVSLRGFGPGPHFNGNGQLWYDENRGKSNQPGRPIAITFFNSTNLYVEGLRWTQAQFWHSFISHCNNVTMENIVMNSTSSNGNSTVNTDGTDTWNSRDVILRNWTVQNGDDCLAIKGNSSNVHVSRITCHGSGSVPIGSVGHDPAHPDYVQDILVEDIVLYDSSNAAWIKTWQGNAGGFVRNVTWRNMACHNVNQPIYVTQCIYSGADASGTCDASTMRISDVTWQNITGTSRYNVAGSLHCSRAAPCKGLRFIDVHITSVEASQARPAPPELYLCANVAGQNSSALGIPCRGVAPSNFPQQLKGNYGVCADESVAIGC